METSGLQGFQIATAPDVSASRGFGGAWLIDPNNIEIVAGAGNTNINPANPFATTDDSAQLGVDLITAALTGGASVSVTTGTSGVNSEAGDITLSTPLDFDGTGINSLTLNAANDIVINGQITDSVVGGDSLNLTLNADSDASGAGGVTIAQSISTGVAGNLTVAASGAIQQTGGALTVAGTTTLSAGAVNDITLNQVGNDFVGTVSSTGNDVVLVDVNAIDLGASTISGAFDVTATSISTSGTIAGTGDITLTTDAIALNNPISGTGNLTITPQTVATTIGLGNSSTGILNLDATELGNLTDGFSGITIGDATSGTGVVDITSSTFTDNITIVGGAIAVDQLDAGTNTATLTARTRAIEESGFDAVADITAATIDLNAATGIGTAAQIETTGSIISADTTNGNIDLENLATAATTITSATTGTGSIDLTQTGNQTLAVTTATTTDGTINIANTGANLTVTTAIADGANNITLGTTTIGDVFIDSVSATGDTITINSAGAIAESGTDSGEDVTASAMRLDSVAGVGTAADPLETTVTTVAAQASASGGVFISETDDIVVDTVDTLAGITAVSDSIVLKTTTGSITTNGVVSAGGTSNILVQAQGTGSDVTLNAGVTSGSGNITVLAADAVSQAATGDLSTIGGTIDVEATTDAITMTDGATSISGNGNIRYNANGDVTLGGLNAGTGDVSILSSMGDILDGGDTDQEVVANELRLSATGTGGGIGSSTGNQKLEINVDTISAAADGDGIFLLEADNIAIDMVNDISINRVGMDGSTSTVTDVGRADLETTSNGPIVLQTTNGTITVNDGDADNVGVSANGTGNILLQAQETATTTTANITLNTGVTSGSGNISVIAADAVTQAAAGDITTTGETIDVEATGGAITMIDGATSTSGNGNIRYNGDGNVTLGGLMAGTGDVIVISTTGGILDGGDTDTDISANEFQFDAGSNVGSTTDKLDIAVDAVSGVARGTDGIFLSEQDNIAVDTVSAVSVNRVGMDATTSTITDAGRSDLETTNNGAIILQTTNGSITVNDGDADNVGVIANGIGNILLQAQGIGQNFIANTGIRSGSGNIAILAPDAISLANSTADITTGGGDIDLQASSLTTLSGVTVSSDGGDIRQVVTGNLLLTHLTNAGTGNVNLITGGSILDDSDTDTVDIEAAGLLISAITNVGERTNFIETSVDTISATAGGFQVLSTFSQGVTQGIHLLDSDAVTVGNVSVATSQVQMDGSVMTTTNSGSDLTTTGSDAPIALKTTNGPITINDGTDGDNLGISANGSGSILLQAQGTGSDIMVNTGITSGSGNISILAADSISQTGTSADITTSGGTIDLEATTGSIAMTTSTTAANSNGGTIRYRAGTNVGVGFIDAGTGDVSIMAGVGSIVDISAATDASAGEDDSSVNIQADELRLQAGDSIGLNTEFLETTVNRVSGIAAGIQGINLLETDDVTVGTVGPVSVARVQMDASTVTITDGTQSDLITSGNNGPIALKTSNGSIIIDDGDNNNIGVGVNGDGNILLQAQGSDRSITLNTAFHSDTGYISILVPNSINQANATSDISTDGGTIDLEAATGTISQADGAQTTSNGGNIRYSAGQNITLSNLNAGTGDISLITNNGDILDGGDSDLEIQADEILVQIGSGSLGSSPNPLEIQVNTASLRTNPANAVHLNPLDGLRLGAIGEITVNRVQMNPTVTVPISDGDTPAGGGATPGPTSPTIDTPEDRLPREEEGKAPTEPGPFNQALVAQSPCPPVDVGLEKLESDYSNEFREYLNIGEDNAAGANSQVLTIACDTLGTVAGITGITPALLYANFVPAGEPEQNLPYGGDSGGDRAREPNPSDQLDLLLVMPDGSTVYKRVATATRGQVAQEVEALVLAITDRIDEEFPAAQQLYQWLIAPLESELEQGQVENLVFIADIALRSLPFAVLHDGEQFLIEKYSLGLMPSLSLTNTRRHNIATNQILAMGTAEFPGQAPLPFVPLELDLVLSGPWQGRDFANQAFTLENLKTAQADSGFGIVHLATHATFNMGAPDRSTIQFADGQLSLENIQEVNWDGVNLLVLSACETAIGDREAELGWAGIAAKTGVESVLASLWPVEDGGSTALMAEFYRQLHQTSTKAEALRQTQLAMLRREIRFSQGQLQLPDGNRIAIPEALQAQLSADFDHPYHWAAFTLVGSPW